MPTVKAGNRICQPITQANCRRDSRTGSRSMVDPLSAPGDKTDKTNDAGRSWNFQQKKKVPGENLDPSLQNLHAVLAAASLWFLSARMWSVPEGERLSA